MTPTVRSADSPSYFVSYSGSTGIIDQSDAGNLAEMSETGLEKSVSRMNASASMNRERLLCVREEAVLFLSW